MNVWLVVKPFPFNLFDPSAEPIKGDPMRIVLEWISKLLMVMTLVMNLVACASNPSSDGSGQEIITDSDETDASKRSRIRLELAGGYFEQGQTTIALDELKQSLLINPNNPEAFNLRGLIYMRLGEKQLAEDSFKRSLVLSPKNASVMHNYGWFLCNQLRFREATDLLNQALATPNYLGAGKTHMALGMCYQKNNQPVEAERSYSRSYELDSGNPIVGYNLALLQFQRGDDSRAQFYVRRINNSEFVNAQTLWLGVKVERRLGNTQAARDLGDQLQRKFANSEEARKYEKGQFND